jgi:hypothetical protein
MIDGENHEWNSLNPSHVRPDLVKIKGKIKLLKQGRRIGSS